jgi:hypothetical protein
VKTPDHDAPISEWQLYAAALETATRKQAIYISELQSALLLIAAPKRPDGTWNRDRESCRQLAASALDQCKTKE